MSKKKSILDMLEENVREEIKEEPATTEPNKVVVMNGNTTRRQTYCMTLRNLELIRQASFLSQTTKQDIVNHAVEAYIQNNFPDLYKRVVNFE